MADKSRLLTPADVAKRMGWGVRHTRRQLLATPPLMPVIRLGARVLRVDEADFEAFLESRKRS